MKRRWLGRLAAVFLAGTFGPAYAGTVERGTLVAGDARRQGDVAIAGPEGAILELKGGARLSLEPSAELRLLPVTDIELAGGKTRPAHVVLLRSGVVDVDTTASRHDGPAVLVNVPERLGGILLEGRMTVLARPRRTSVASRRGTVLAGEGSRWAPLGPGRVRTVDPAHPVGFERGLPEEPRWLAGTRIWLTPDAAAGVSDLAWTRASEASSYRLLVQRAGEPGPFQVVGSAAPALPSPLELPAGSYRATVIGVDSEGLVGFPSPELGLTVVRLALPPGAYFEGTARVRLHPGQAIGLSGVEDLELAYGAGDTWVPASSRIELFRDEPTRVRLRARGGGATTTLDLVPHGVTASITIGPRSARWPSTPVRVEIRLRGDRDAAAGSRLGAEPRVFLGTEELPVTWQAAGGALRTTVSPQPGAGPWLLRVAVTDPQGHPLGEEFFEIATDDERRR